MTHSFTFYFFFFNDTATTEIYTLSLHDALPILPAVFLKIFIPLLHSSYKYMDTFWDFDVFFHGKNFRKGTLFYQDRKSTRLNSSHVRISYAVFCLKKKKKKTHILTLCNLDCYIS